MPTGSCGSAGCGGEGVLFAVDYRVDPAEHGGRSGRVFRRDTDDLAGEASLVGVGDVVAGEDEDRHVAGGRVVVERGDDRETVEVRHHDRR
jgi:hypothetical protein